MNKIQPLRDCTVVSLRLIARDGHWGEGENSFDSHFAETGSSGAIGHKRQHGVVEGLAQVAERLSHMGIRTEDSGLPAQHSLCYTVLPLVEEAGQSDG